MREPAGMSGGGSAGGRSGACAAGGASVERPSSGPGSTTDGANANETEGARECETGVVSPGVLGIWSDPTHRGGPYPSHSSATSPASDEAGQQSQSIAATR